MLEERSLDGKFSSKFIDFDIFNSASKCFKTFYWSSYTYYLNKNLWNSKHSLIIKIPLKMLIIVQKTYLKNQILSSKFLNFDILNLVSKCFKTFNKCYFDYFFGENFWNRKHSPIIQILLKMLKIVRKKIFRKQNFSS